MSERRCITKCGERICWEREVTPRTRYGESGSSSERWILVSDPYGLAHEASSYSTQVEYPEPGQEKKPQKKVPPVCTTQRCKSKKTENRKVAQ